MLSAPIIKGMIRSILDRFKVDGSVESCGSIIIVDITYHCRLCESCGKLHPDYFFYINREIAKIAQDNCVDIKLKIFGCGTTNLYPYHPSILK